MNAGLFVLVVLLFLGAEAFKVGVLAFSFYHVSHPCLFKVGSNLVLAEWTAHFSAETNWNYIGYYRFICQRIQLHAIHGISYGCCQLKEM